MSYKKQLALIVAVILFPLALMAAGGNSKNNMSDENNPEKASGQSDVAKEKNSNRTCEKLEAVSSKIDQKVERIRESIQTKREARLADFEKKVLVIDAKRKEFRTQVEGNLDQQFSLMEKNADTEAEKEAAADFKVAIKKAIETRRASIDETIRKFRIKVKEAAMNRKNDLDSLIEGYMNSRKSIYEEAQTACQGGGDAKSIIQKVRDDLKQARNKFMEEKRSQEKLRISIQEQISLRKQSFQEANEQFKLSLEKAREDYKKAIAE